MKRCHHKPDSEAPAGEITEPRYLFVCPACSRGNEIPADLLERRCGAQARIADILADMECAYCSGKP